MAAQLTEAHEEFAVLFLSDVGKRDPSQALIAALSDLSVKPISAAKFVQERPEDVQLQVVDKQSGKKGQVVEIIRATPVADSEVQLEVRYGVVGSVLTVREQNGSWHVTREDVQHIVVASARKRRAVQLGVAADAARLRPGAAAPRSAEPR